MLQNAYLIAKIGADTAENKRNFATKLATAARRGGGPQRQGELEEPAAAQATAARLREPRSVGWQNFGKMFLVFGCIGTDLCN